MNTIEKTYTIKSVKSVNEYTNNDVEKLTVASSAFVNASIGLCTFANKNIKNKENNLTSDEIYSELQSEISNKLTAEENEKVIKLYNYFYSEDKRKVL